MRTQLVRNLLLFGAAASMVGVVPSLAAAQVIEACYQNATGSLRVVSSSNECHAAETSISWNITGPPGPPGTITPPLILSGSVQGGIIEVTNSGSPSQFGVVAFGPQGGLVGEGIVGVVGDGQVTGVSGTALVSASRGGLFESKGATGFGVIATASHQSIPGTGVQGTAVDAVFVPPGSPNPVLGTGVRGSGYLGIIGSGRQTASPGFPDMALQGAGVQGFGYIGVFGRSANGFAGFFDGNVNVTGTLSATTVNQSSDRSLKENFANVDGRAILRSLRDVPVQMWNYTASPGARHIGPTAQDFFKAFALGDDDRHITTVDESGVALAAIQSLYELLLDKEREMSTMKEELASLKADIERLKSGR